jgi:hypothetical protein
MMLLKADQRTEAGVLPTREDMEVMGKYNQALIDAGALVDAAGLQASSKGARITFPGGRPVVTDGPFAETKELIAGYWIIRVASREDAIAWAKRVPVAQLPGTGRVPEIELRQMFELSDFPDIPVHISAQEQAFASNRTDS